MNQRYVNSLINDTNLMIQVSLVNILLLIKEPYQPWTNPDLTGVPGLKN